MATYLQGVEPFIPDYQPFQPNLNFYAKALQTKQNQYDTNWKQLNVIGNPVVVPPDATNIFLFVILYYTLGEKRMNDSICEWDEPKQLFSNPFSFFIIFITKP